MNSTTKRACVSIYTIYVLTLYYALSISVWGNTVSNIAYIYIIYVLTLYYTLSISVW